MGRECGAEQVSTGRGKGLIFAKSLAREYAAERVQLMERSLAIKEAALSVDHSVDHSVKISAGARDAIQTRVKKVRDGRDFPKFQAPTRPSFSNEFPELAPLYTEYALALKQAGRGEEGKKWMVKSRELFQRNDLFPLMGVERRRAESVWHNEFCSERREIQAEV